MTKFAISVLAAALALPSWSVAGNSPSESRPKPGSYAPQPHTNQHVYGTPIQPAIVGHAKSSQHKHTPKKRSASSKRQR
jgi:hypothetical protein